jgi:hypothetical protein
MATYNIANIFVKKVRGRDGENARVKLYNEIMSELMDPADKNLPEEFRNFCDVYDFNVENIELIDKKEKEEEEEEEEEEESSVSIELSDFYTEEDFKKSFNAPDTNLFDKEEKEVVVVKKERKRKVKTFEVLPANESNADYQFAVNRQTLQNLRKQAEEYQNVFILAADLENDLTEEQYVILQTGYETNAAYLKAHTYLQNYLNNLQS